MSEPARLKAGLSLFDATAIVAGSMIGSGIFIVSADITRQTGSPAALLLVWIVSGLMTIVGALAYGELAAMLPHAGGQYVFLREAYGEPIAFSFGWALLLVIQTGTIAAVAVAFARFAAVFCPTIGPQVLLGNESFGLSYERLVAIAVILLLTAVNLRGLDYGKLVQNLFTGTKILSLLLIVLVGCFLWPNRFAIQMNFGTGAGFFGDRPLSIGWAAAFGAAMVGGLFSADAWGSVTFAASEVREPGRNLPKALALGAGVVVILYVLTNIAYLCELPAMSQPSLIDHGGGGIFAHGIANAQGDRVGTAAMRVVFGHAGATVMALLVMVSTFGCANGLILTGARVIYAMACDGLFFAMTKQLNAASVPAPALLIQAGWAALLTVSGTYSELLDYVIFAQLLFYVLTVGAVFILRFRLPEAPRPYRAWGYPWAPTAYIIAAGALMIDLLIVRPHYTWPGLIIALSALPVYAMTVYRRGSQALD